MLVNWLDHFSGYLRKILRPALTPPFQEFTGPIRAFIYSKYIIQNFVANAKYGRAFAAPTKTMANLKYNNKNGATYLEFAGAENLSADIGRPSSDISKQSADIGGLMAARSARHISKFQHALPLHARPNHTLDRIHDPDPPAASFKVKIFHVPFLHFAQAISPTQVELNQICKIVSAANQSRTRARAIRRTETNTRGHEPHGAPTTAPATAQLLKPREAALRMADFEDDTPVVQDNFQSVDNAGGVVVGTGVGGDEGSGGSTELETKGGVESVDVGVGGRAGVGGDDVRSVGTSPDDDACAGNGKRAAGGGGGSGTTSGGAGCPRGGRAVGRTGAYA
ncbi:hypothetical protein GGX14DRAFT_659428 [Mycena pura]|uniref:Uncharacterized protein n=1 Tax=Mycena pura TaxID=153505 RepID=A0AAD6V3D6_9AGAR|nr:hypothetical protein GGX14DRAFT_659428 [Mycena pura]